MLTRYFRLGSRAAVVARLMVRPVCPQVRKCLVRPGGYAWCQNRTHLPQQIQIVGTQIFSPGDMSTRGGDAPVEGLKVINFAWAPARFRAFPHDTGIALKGDKPVACVGPILKLLDGHVIAGLAAGTAGEECPRDIDHVRRALELVQQRRTAAGAEASGRVRLRILVASDASSTPRHAGMLAPTADVGRIRGAVRATACRGVIVPGPKSGKVDL
jgi:hypothetical protein